MTSSPIPSLEVVNDRHSFGRELLDVTLSYLRWGYGALLVSCVAYAYYLAFQWSISSSVRLSTYLAAIATVLTLAVAGSLWRRTPTDYRLPSRLSRPTSESPKPRTVPRSR